MKFRPESNANEDTTTGNTTKETALPKVNGADNTTTGQTRESSTTKETGVPEVKRVSIVARKCECM